MAILVTGGLGYIGSHTCVELLNAGEDVIVIDNLYNSKIRVVDAIINITNKGFGFYQNDVRDKEALRKIFRENFIEAVIHFAGYKAVAESVAKPIEYYDNNIGSTIALLEVMREFGCKKIVFSSSATVYGIPKTVPITEDFPIYSINPYGQTKVMIEQILKDLYNSDNEWGISLLRYFNPIGAHESTEIGDDPNGIPNNLMPIILRVASGKAPNFSVTGHDYDTRDGSGVRDYLHVIDLALGHIAAINRLRKVSECEAYNLGTGTGSSVFEIVSAFEKVNNITIPYILADRRPGDAAECYANPKRAKEILGWEAKRTLEDMVKSSWEFAKRTIL